MPNPPLIVTAMNPGQYRALMWQLAAIPDGVRIAASTAVNKTAAHGRTMISREVAAVMTAKKSGVDKRISVKKATRAKLFASLNLHGKFGVSLIAFFAKQNATGVMAKIFGQNKEFPHAFIRPGVGGNSVANTPGNNVVFERDGTEKRMMEKGRYKGKMRVPLKVLKGPTVPETFEQTPGLQDKSLAWMQEDLQKNMNSQVDWLLKRGKAQESAASEAA